MIYIFYINMLARILANRMKEFILKKSNYSTTEILEILGVPFYRLEHLVRVGKVKPLISGRRGVERRFTVEEFEKAKRLLAEPADLQRG